MASYKDFAPKSYKDFSTEPEPKSYKDFVPEPKQIPTENSLLENAREIGIKALSALDKSYKMFAEENTLSRQARHLKLLDFLATPAGQYYAELGAKIDSEYIMRHAGVPEHFDIPDMSVSVPLPGGNKQININPKFPPWIVKLLEVSGGDVKKTQDRLALAVFLDGLAGHGYDRLRSAVLKVNKPSGILGELANDMKAQAENFSKMSPEALAATERELAQTGRATTESPKDFYVTSTRADDFVVNGMKYRLDPSGAVSPYKYATDMDKAQEIAKTVEVVNKPELLFDDVNSIEDLLPKPGQRNIDPVGLLARGPMSYLRSPQYYAPEVYETIGLMERRASQISRALWKELAPFERFEGTELAKKVGLVADGHPDAHILLESGELGNEGIAMLEKWREMSAKAADALNLPEEKRIINYLTHIWEDQKLKDYGVDKRLEFLIKENGKYLKERMGGKGYNLDIISAAKTYFNWVGKHIATKEFKGELFDLVGKMRDVDRVRGDMAELYLFNYFGELSKKLPTHADRLKLAANVKTNFAQATLGYNISTPILNLTQPLLFGSSRIGYWPLAKGYVRAIEALKRGGKWKKVLDDGAILSSKSISEFMSGQSFWEKLIPKKAIDFGMSWMQGSENINKASVYLGAFDDVYTKIKYAQTVGAIRAKRVISWLTSRGIKADGNIETEAHKYARKCVADTQFDYTRAGHTYMALQPELSTAYMYMTFPVKAAEYVGHTVGAALKHIGKAVAKPSLLPAVLRMPEVRNAFRLATNFAVLNVLAAKAGVSISNVVGIQNFIPQMAPLWNVAYTTYQGIEGLINRDPIAGEKVARGLMIFSGFPLSAPIWKMKALFTVLNDPANKGNTKEWTIRNPRNGMERFKIDPWEYISHIFSPVKSKTYEDFWEETRAKASDSKKINNLRNAAKLLMLRGEREKASKIKQEIRDTKSKLRARERASRFR